MGPGMRMLGFIWNDLPLLYDMKSRSMYKRATVQSLYYFRSHRGRVQEDWMQSVSEQGIRFKVFQNWVRLGPNTPKEAQRKHLVHRRSYSQGTCHVLYR